MSEAIYPTNEATCGLLGRIKDDLSASIAAKENYKKDVLKVLIAETQRLKYGEVTDKSIVAICKKMIESNLETIKHLPTGDSRKNALAYENQILSNYVPKTATKEEIYVEVLKLKDQMALTPDSQAMKIAMTHLRDLQMVVDGKVVKEVVDSVRR